MHPVIKGKIWGSTSCLFMKNNVEIHRISAKKGGYCSQHRHKNKWNAFFVESGCLEIIIYREDAGQAIEDRTILKAGDSTYVEPGVFHTFRAKEDTVAFEVYWVELEEQDIDRRDVGGVDTID